jgi:hypothetical protein
MLGSLLDNIYGAWFLPERTFRLLRQQPVLWQAFGVVALLNILEAIRRFGFNLPSLVLAVLAGFLGWVSLAAFVAGPGLLFWAGCPLLCGPALPDGFCRPALASAGACPSFGRGCRIPVGLGGPGVVWGLAGAARRRWPWI